MKNIRFFLFAFFGFLMCVFAFDGEDYLAAVTKSPCDLHFDGGYIDSINIFKWGTDIDKPAYPHSVKASFPSNNFEFVIYSDDDKLDVIYNELEGYWSGKTRRSITIISESPLYRSAYYVNGSNHAGTTIYQYEVNLSNGKTFYCLSDVAGTDGDGSFECTADFSYFSSFYYYDYDVPHAALLEKMFNEGIYPPQPEPVYNSSLGYLKDVSIRRLRLTDSDGNADVMSDMYRILFNSQSTTGIDLFQEDIFIRVHGQCSIYDKKWKLVSSDMPLIHFADLSVSGSTAKIDFMDNSFFECVNNGTGQDVIDEIYNGWTINFNGYLRRDTIYLQLCKRLEDGSVEYGGYTKLAVCGVDYATLEDSYSISTITPDFNSDDSGYTDNRVDEDLGLGTTYDDGNLNIEQNGGVDNPSKDFTNSAESVLNMIGAFPSVIASLFSFLPAWCLELVAIAFGSMVAIFFVKLIF